MVDLAAVFCYTDFTIFRKLAVPMAKGGAHLAPKSSNNKKGGRRLAEPAGKRPTEKKEAPAPVPRETAPASRASRREADPASRVSRREAAAPAAQSRKKRRGTGFPLWPVVVVLAAVMLFAGWRLIDILLGYKKDRAAYDALRDIAIVQLTPAPRPAELPPEEPDSEVPVVEEPSEIPIRVDWALLQQTNPEIIAWLYCPDSMINYPVVQTADNEKYLDTNFEGGYSAGGTLFADADCVLGIRQSHFIIYGHNMKDNSMFGTLKNYGEKSYYDQHPVMYLLTPGQSYRIDLLACQTIDAVKSNYPIYFSTDEDYSAYMGRMTGGAYWVNPEAADIQYQFVTMSTCTSSDRDRLVLQGILVPIE